MARTLKMETTSPNPQRLAAKAKAKAARRHEAVALRNLVKKQAEMKG
jgi:hypothetical protein